MDFSLSGPLFQADNKRKSPNPHQSKQQRQNKNQNSKKTMPNQNTVQQNSPGLYIHIPFCKSRCFYCRFTNTLKNTPEQHKNFLDMLEREAAFEAPRHKTTVFKTLYLGGGTPSALSCGEIERLFGIINTHFKISPWAERTMEVNPDDITAQKSQLIARCGINRASMGFQTFDDKMLEKIGRKHNAQTSKQAFNTLCQAGIKNISADLMVSLPGQTPAMVAKDLDQICALDPEQVTVYELTIEPKTVFENLLGQKKITLPDEQTQLEIINTVKQRLKNAGYENYELLSWAKPGFESAHNTNYWQNGQYLGLGPGAYSYLNFQRYTKAADFKTYMQKCKAGDFSAQHTETLSPAQRQHETLQLALRLDEGILIKDFPIVDGCLKPQIEQLEKLSLVARSKNHLKLTDRGKLLAESVFSMLGPP